MKETLNNANKLMAVVENGYLERKNIHTPPPSDEYTVESKAHIIYLTAK